MTDRTIIITPALVEHVKQFLGEDGAHFFSWVKEKHGRYDAVWWVDLSNGERFPHPVHLREGRQVRNSMRQHPDCAGWDAHDFDGAWTTVVELCLSKVPLLRPVEVSR